MRKQEIAEEVGRRTGIETIVCRTIINETFKVMADSLGNGQAIYIRGLFTLKPVFRKEKVGQIITKKKSAKAIVLPAHYAPHAKFSKKIVDKLAKKNV